MIPWNGSITHRFLRARRGAVVIFAAMSSLAIIGMAAFAVDLGGAYVARSQNQVVADMAAYSGALAYSANPTTAAMNNAVARIATLNGLPTSAIAASLGWSPTADGNNAVKAVVTTTAPAYLTSALGGAAMPVTAMSYAEIKAGTPGCITALQSSGTGISVTGGTSITATNCAVASNGTVAGQNSSVYVTCGAKITTAIVDYTSNTPPVQSGCTDILPPTGTPSVTFTKSVSADQLAGNSRIVTATNRIATAAAVTPPAVPTVTGGVALSLGYYPTTLTPSQLPSGCTGVLTSSTWNISCPNSGTYTFGAISLGGGLSLNINVGAAAATRTFNFNGDLNATSGNAISFGAGTFNISGGIVTSGSMVVTFTSGSVFNIGTTSSCGGGSGYSICTSGSTRVIMPGPGTFSFAGGIYQGASGMPSSAAVTIGSGSTANTFALGKSSSGYSINAANGALILGDASTTGHTFTMAGGMTTAGGTCVQISAAAQHDINGSINASGGIYLGAGIYTVNGYAAFGAANGGDVGNCPTSGATTGVSALGVALVVSGTSTITCNGYTAAAFCLGAGYSHVSLTAPTSASILGASASGIAVLGPTVSSRTGGAYFTTGATNTQISGAFYFPYGTIGMSGGAQLHDTVDTTACLELIGAQISLVGGGVLGSTCSGLPGSLSAGGSNIAIVQ